MNEIDELASKLNSAEEADRIYAAEDIGYANHAEGVAPLFARLPDEPSRAAREAIFGALQSIEDDAVIEAAIGLLASEDPFMRNQAVELLRHCGPKVIPFLRQAFPTAGRDERKMVIDVLAAVDGPGSAEIYDLALNDADVNVLITAVESLGNARKTEFRERVEQLLISPDPMLLGACLETLAQIGNANSLAAFRSCVTVGGFADFLLPSYLKVLGAHGDKSAITEASAMLGSRGAHLQHAIVDAITMLQQRHPSASLPESLVEPLENIVRTGKSDVLRHQARRLLEGLTKFAGVTAFVAGCPERDPELALKDLDV